MKETKEIIYSIDEIEKRKDNFYRFINSPEYKKGKDVMLPESHYHCPVWVSILQIILYVSTTILFGYLVLR